MGKKDQKLTSKPIAFCAMMAALGTVIMLTGGLIPVLTYCSPLIVSFLLIPVLDQHVAPAVEDAHVHDHAIPSRRLLFASHAGLPRRQTVYRIQIDDLFHIFAPPFTVYHPARPGGIMEQEITP